MREFSAEPIDLGKLLSPVSLFSGIVSAIKQSAFPLVMGLSIAAIAYGLLPLLGVKLFSSLLSFKMVLMMCVALAGGVSYWIFLDFIKKRPDWLLYLSFIGLPLLACFSNTLLMSGINLYKNAWLIMGVCGPVLYMAWPYIRGIWQQLPVYKYFVLYLLIAGYFYIFNNHLVYDQRFTAGTQPLSFHAFFASIYHFMTITLVGCAILLEKRPRQVFEAINFLVLWVTLIYAIITLVAYPFHIFTEFSENVHRTRFIFLYTNKFAFYMQFFITYLLGVYFYQLEVRQKDTNTRFPWQVMYPVSIVLGTLSMVTSFTKTSIGMIILLGAFILLCNIHRVLKQKAMMIALASLPVVLVVGLVIFQATSGTNLMDGIETRINNTESMDWRSHAWDNLLSDMEPIHWVTGHGFTASNERMQLFEQFHEGDGAADATSTSNASQILAVHNGYLSQTYDFGIAGILLMIALMISSVKIAGAMWFKQYQSPALWAIDTTLLAMMMTFLGLCMVSNTFDEIDLPFWVLISVLFFVRHQLHQALLQQSANQTPAVAA